VPMASNYRTIPAQPLVRKWLAALLLERRRWSRASIPGVKVQKWHEAADLGCPLYGRFAGIAEIRHRLPNNHDYECTP
jgi:hypothetical protein